MRKIKSPTIQFAEVIWRKKLYSGVSENVVSFQLYCSFQGDCSWLLILVKTLLFIVTPVKMLLFDEVVTLICLLDLMINYLVFLYLIHVKFLFTSYITSTMKYFVFCIPFC